MRKLGIENLNVVRKPDGDKGGEMARLDVIDDKHEIVDDKEKTGAVVVYRNNLPRVQGRFAELENLIADDLTTMETRFYRLGCTLREIRDERLYLQTHKTFEQYTRKRWNIGKAYVYRLIKSSEVIENLSPRGDKFPDVQIDEEGDSSPIGDKIKATPLPATENQIRPLTQLPPEQQVEAWQKAVETAPDGKITARHVNKIVNEFRNQNIEEAIQKKRVIEVDDEIDDPEILGKFHDFIRFLNELSRDRWKRVTRRKAKLYLERVMIVFRALP